MLSTAAEKKTSKHFNLINIKFIRPVLMFITSSPWPLFFLKIISVSFFILVIYAGLKGTPIAERNIATVLTWNIWWTGLIVSIFFFGSAWCAICPWDALASWFVKPKIWINKKLNFKINNSLLIMFMGLTWLELGVGVTTSPYWTALLSLLMVVIYAQLEEPSVFIHNLLPLNYDRLIQMFAQTVRHWNVLMAPKKWMPAPHN